jgi:predicted MFS family arabinose efflux permease
VTSPASERWLVAALCTALLLNMVGFANIAVVLPAVSADLSLDAGHAGLLGGAFFFAYALGVPLFVPLTDRLPPLIIYAVGSVCWIAGGLTVALAHDGIALPLAGRVLSGFGMAATFMPGLLMLVARLPAERRSSAAATYSSCITLGTGFCFAVTGAVALALPWRAAFLVASLTAALALILVAIVIVWTPPRIETETNHAGNDSHPLGFLVKRRLVGLFAAVAGNAWEGMAFRTWWIAYLVFVAGGKPDGERLAQLAIVTALAGLLAMPLSVAVARRAQGQRRVPMLVLACIASGAFALVPPLLANLPLPFAILLTTLYLCFVFADAGTLSAAVLEESPPARRGVAMAASATVSNVAAFSGTAAVGAVLGLAGGPTSQAAWLAAFATMGLGSAAGGIALWIISRPARQTQRQAATSP